jgi:hypothetical protein
VGVTGVAGGSFHHEEGRGADLSRFPFAASDDRVDEAEANLREGLTADRGQG